jgi:hypothetical protein
VAAIKDELQAARRRAAAAASQAAAAEQRVQASMYHSRERFAEMEQEVKRTAQVSERSGACLRWLLLWGLGLGAYAVAPGMLAGQHVAPLALPLLPAAAGIS